jgi:hypothetical protein
MNHSSDVQGHFLGLPYDFRRPTLRKIVQRCYQPAGPILVPKVWGAGWTLNLAHAGSWWLIGSALLAGLIAIVG